ncbi:lysozyme inhibitor LprI family protein [Flavobacterium reichenbachii]|uniref:lysozyme inhibitor LprI family protein n=1 Tax=Flavobacterium reichenbachii TaxID=362418 RepID=UPI0006912B87|nr:lysozyme inhibitor LprI family protein [Flavobacterium reichenbachii]OXB16717.1 hypothetical protein B0A68_06200 [Flavobacterium reichenbachii]
MKKTFFIIFFSLCLAGFSQKSKKKEDLIDIRKSKCLDKNDISTAEMCNCEIKAREDWDKQLNSSYNLLKAKLSKDAFEILKQSQKQWIIYRDNEFEFISKYYYEVKQGTMWYPVAEGRKTEIVKARTIELKRYYDSIEY